MAKNLKQLDGAATLKRALPQAVAPTRQTGNGEGVPLALKAPESLVRELKVAAAERGVTVRVLVLEALKQAGFTVDPAELRDRRR